MIHCSITCKLKVPKSGIMCLCKVFVFFSEWSSPMFSLSDLYTIYVSGWMSCSSIQPLWLASWLERLEINWSSLPDELGNFDKFDRCKRFLKTILFSCYHRISFFANEMYYINLCFTYFLSPQFHCHFTWLHLCCNISLKITVRCH